MIGYLEGRVKFKHFNHLIVLAGGVGYKVYTTNTILTTAKLDSQISLFIYSHIKDDAFDLYGLLDHDELALFELFLGVSGIGPKTALGVFSVGKLTKIKEAIVKGDVDFFTQVPRLGRKNAQKIIIELRPKLGKLGDLDLSEDSPESKEISDALKTFGFNAGEAKEAIKGIKDVQGDTSIKIRAALKYLGK